MRVTVRVMTHVTTTWTTMAAMMTSHRRLEIVTA